jgi:hypothetical protein
VQKANIIIIIIIISKQQTNMLRRHESFHKNETTSRNGEIIENLRSTTRIRLQAAATTKTMTTLNIFSSNHIHNNTTTAETTPYIIIRKSISDSTIFASDVDRISIQQQQQQQQEKEEGLLVNKSNTTACAGDDHHDLSATACNTAIGQSEYCYDRDEVYSLDAKKNNNITKSSSSSSVSSSSSSTIPINNTNKKQQPNDDDDDDDDKKDNNTNNNSKLKLEKQDSFELMYLLMAPKRTASLLLNKKNAKPTTLFVREPSCCSTTCMEDSCTTCMSNMTSLSKNHSSSGPLFYDFNGSSISSLKYTANSSSAWSWEDEEQDCDNDGNEMEEESLLLKEGRCAEVSIGNISRRQVLSSRRRPRRRRTQQIKGTAQSSSNDEQDYPTIRMLKSASMSIRSLRRDVELLADEMENLTNDNIKKSS